ncbi:MAG: hypothetical protein NC342_04210 [Pseudoflavonifractor sp.]|nr:hypothetical protein [Alloprevotella sp.]MCM1116720.1 hypothetical protein [Pseudoflavonifractor sp.]
MSTNQDPSNLAQKESEEAMANELKTKKAQKTLMWIMIAASAVIICVIIYIFAIREPGKKAANDAVAQADMSLSLGQDSLALAQYQQVADNYGYDAGNRAALSAAIILYRQAQADTTSRDAKLNEAIKYLKQYDTKESIIGASSRSLMGDCYVNLGNLIEGRKCFEEAAKLSDNNPAYTPFFMMKEATVCRELGEYSEEAAIYQKIIDLYPDYGQTFGVDLEKYLARAKAQAEAK